MDKSVKEDTYDNLWRDDEKAYSAEHLGYTPHFVRFMQKWAKPRAKAASQALEVGCGDGFFSSKLSDLGYKVTGIDLSPLAIANARNKYKEIQFQVHDLENPLPFHDSTFDLVWCSEVLEHLYFPGFALDEIYRVLSSGGIFLCTVPFHGVIKNLGIALFAFERYYDPTYPHVRFFTKRSLGNLVSAVGLDVREIKHCGSGLGLRDIFVPTNILLAAGKCDATQ